MTKEIEKLSIQELIELKTIVDYMSEEYAKMLTDYATLNSDYSFSKITNDKKIIYDKRINLCNLTKKINNRIEKIIEDYV